MLHYPPPPPPGKKDTYQALSQVTNFSGPTPLPYFYIEKNCEFKKSDAVLSLIYIDRLNLIIIFDARL